MDVLKRVQKAVIKSYIMGIYPGYRAEGASVYRFRGLGVSGLVVGEGVLSKNSRSSRKSYLLVKT